MDVLVVSDAGVERHDADELPKLLKQEDALIWVDIPACDPAAVQALTGVFGFHRIAMRDCVERNHVSKVSSTPTMCSPCCTRRRSDGAATCTTSSWTSSSAQLSGHRPRPAEPGGRPAVAPGHRLSAAPDRGEEPARLLAV